MTPDEELADLQKKYQLLEGDRKAYYETSQWTIKQNRETIAIAKRENKELRAQLAACHATKGGKPKDDGATAELEKLRVYVKELRKRYDEIHLLTNKKQSHLNSRLDRIKDLERDAVRATDEDSPMMRHIRMLENRLDKALIKFNEAQSIRRTYEQIVKRLREERIGFDNQLAAIERTLKAKEHDLEELVLMSHDANHAKEVAKAELTKIDSQLTTERADREKDLQERRNQVKARQEMNSRMESRERNRKEMHLEALGDLSQAQEEGLKSQVVTSHFMHEANEKHLEDMQRRITTFEEAFKKIKEATGVSDVNEVIQKFMTQEDTHNNLKQITKESQTRIDQLNAERSAIVARLEELKYSGTGLDGSRRLVDEYEMSLEEATLACETERVKYERVAKTLIAMKAGIEHLADKLVPLKLDAANIPLTEETVVDVLAQSEQKLTKVYESLMATEETGKKLQVQGNTALGAEDLPANNSRIETAAAVQESDEEDDDGSDVEDALDVPDREYVKTSAQQMTDKKGKGRKKRGMGDSPPPSPGASGRKGGGMSGKISGGNRAGFA
eukprot:CAMPEP_0196571392 /NCGR_PEP_ID=MMETSP1081-20130531/1575_1 /TAXON_ID=36882 /ORGANISM="Pyramimonas amylifera, Strain CCMP720" /LENGTH=559 /DNA_ID=CAMNT_0041888327 /DNA_START=25 /DNA_END=1704 /DNA_ORIENTATION=+